MSITNKLIFELLKKTVIFYERGKPMDYNKKRELENKLVFISRTPIGVKVKDTKYANVRCHYVSKKGNYKDRIVLYIHGGAFCVGTIDTRIAFTTLIANKKGYNVVAVDYPLAPENPYPAGLNACFEVYKELLKTYKSENIILMGESAGGNLVLTLLLKIKDNGLGIPRLAFSFSPCVQFDKELESYSKNAPTECMVKNLNEEVLDNYLEGNEAMLKDPYVAPIYGDFTGLCPTYLFASKAEVLHDDSILMHEKLKQDGVKTDLFLRKEMIHAWVVIPITRESLTDIRKVFKIIEESYKN